MAKGIDDIHRDERFGKALLKAREARGKTWTQTFLAKQIGVDQTLISAWEHGKKVPRSRPRIEELEEALGPGVCPAGTLTEILFGPDPPPLSRSEAQTPRAIIALVRELLEELDRQLPDDQPGGGAEGKGGSRVLRPGRHGTRRTDNRGKRGTA